MRLFNRKIYKLLKPLKAVNLSAADKAAIKSRLIAELGLNPIIPPIIAPTARWSWWRGMVLASVAALVLGGGGISAAAAGALPGEWLYSVQIKIKEPLGRALVKTHSDASAAFELNLLHKRLSEAEKLLADDKLNEALEESIKLEIGKQATKAMAQTAEKKPETKPDSNNTDQPEELPEATKIETRVKPVVTVEVNIDQIAEKIEDDKTDKMEKVNKLLEKHQVIIDKLEIKLDKLNKSAPVELPGLPTNKNQRP